MFYSKSTGGFYSREIHGDTIPADAVEITEAEHAALIEGQGQGKCIVGDANGRPALQDPAPPEPPTREQIEAHLNPKPNPEQLQAQANAEARAYLAETDWYVIRLQETGEPVPVDILAERSAARVRVIE